MGNKSSSETPPPADASADDLAQEPEQLSYWQMIKQGYQELVNAIIRPPRCQYTEANLGPKVFDFCGKSFMRSDFELRNPRGHKIVCSIWEPTPQFRPNPVLPCLIYMHGNSSARLEALPQLALGLSLGATLLSFDFSGSGLSEGEYVSLGAFEKEDLKVFVLYAYHNFLGTSVTHSDTYSASLNTYVPLAQHPQSLCGGEVWGLLHLYCMANATLQLQEWY